MVGGKPGYLRLRVMGSVAATQTASYAAEYLSHWQPVFSTQILFSPWSQSSPVQLFCRNWATSIDFPFKPILRKPTTASSAMNRGSTGGNQLQYFQRKIASLSSTWAELQIRKIKSENGSVDRLSFQVWYTFSTAFLERILRKQGICLLEQKEILIIGFSAVVSRDNKFLYQSGLRTARQWGLS